MTIVVLRMKNRRSGVVTQPASVVQLARDSLQRAVAQLQQEAEAAGGMGFALLSAHLALHTLVDSRGMAELLADVAECQRRAENRAEHQLGQKGTSQGTHWSDVMMDALRSLLSQPSHLLRTVVKIVMRCLADHLEPSAVTLFSEVLLAEEIRDDDEDDDYEDVDDEDEDEQGNPKSEEVEQLNGDDTMFSSEDSDSDEDDEEGKRIG